MPSTGLQVHSPSSAQPAGERPVVGDSRPIWRLANGLFLCFLAFYLATAGAHTITIDGEYYYRAAESLAVRGSLALQPVSPNDVGRFALRGPDGLIYGKFAPLQSVVEAPFYLVARTLLGRFLGGSGLTEALRVWVPLAATACISAGLVALTAVVVLSLGYSRRVALGVAVILGLATLVWPYGRLDFSEPLQAFLLLGAFLCLRRVHPSGIGLDSTACGFLLGLLMLAKAVNLVVIPIFGLALLWRVRKAPRRAVVSQALTFGAAVLVGVGAFCLLNLARTGSPLDFGYDEPFDTPLLVGLYGWTLSPGKGVFLYMPVLVASAVAFVPFARRHGFEAMVMAATTAILVFFYARFWAWSGDWAWGTRFAVPLLPLWVLPLATALAQWRVGVRVLLGASVAASVLIQTLGVVVNPMSYLEYYYSQVSTAYGEPPGYSWSQESGSQIHFAPESSPLLEQARIFAATVDGSPADPTAGSGLSFPGRQQQVSLVEPPPLARALGIRRWLPTPSGQLLGFDPWPLRTSLGGDGMAALACLGGIMAAGIALIVLGTPRPRPHP